MRLIDADKFEAYSANGTDLKGEEFLAHLSGMQRVLEDIDDAPTIDPESLRPRARWLGEIVLVNGTMSQECSRCHRIRPIDDFCAACGAKMDEEATTHEV